MGIIDKYDILMFDLDGTLTDSGPGIVKSFEYTINIIKGEGFYTGDYRVFVGPPLEDSFSVILGFSEEETAKAVSTYRDYYFNKGGIYDNSVYPDIESTLAKLKELGKTLVVATSKNMKATDIVLEHFDLKKYFYFVASSNFADRHTKSDVINYALSQFECVDKEKVLMIGDRNQDINAANQIGIDSVGVLWGYGDRGELETAGATYIIEKPADLIEG